MDEISQLLNDHSNDVDSTKPLAQKLKQNVDMKGRTSKLITLDSLRLKVGQTAFQNRLICLETSYFDEEKELY